MSEYRFPRPFVYENASVFTPKVREVIPEEEEEKV